MLFWSPSMRSSLKTTGVRPSLHLRAGPLLAADQHVSAVRRAPNRFLLNDCWNRFLPLLIALHPFELEHNRCQSVVAAGDHRAGFVDPPCISPTHDDTQVSPQTCPSPGTETNRWRALIFKHLSIFEVATRPPRRMKLIWDVLVHEILERVSLDDCDSIASQWLSLVLRIRIS